MTTWSPPPESEPSRLVTRRLVVAGACVSAAFLVAGVAVAQQQTQLVAEINGLFGIASANDSMAMESHLEDLIGQQSALLALVPKLFAAGLVAAIVELTMLALMGVSRPFTPRSAAPLREQPRARLLGTTVGMLAAVLLGAALTADAARRQVVAGVGAPTRAGALPGVESAVGPVIVTVALTIVAIGATTRVFRRRTAWLTLIALVAAALLIAVAAAAVTASLGTSEVVIPGLTSVVHPPPGVTDRQVLALTLTALLPAPLTALALAVITGGYASRR